MRSARADNNLFMPVPLEAVSVPICWTQTARRGGLGAHPPARTARPQPPPWHQTACQRAGHQARAPGCDPQLQTGSPPGQPPHTECKSTASAGTSTKPRLLAARSPNFKKERRRNTQRVSPAPLIGFPSLRIGLDGVKRDPLCGSSPLATMDHGFEVLRKLAMLSLPTFPPNFPSWLAAQRRCLSARPQSTVWHRAGGRLSCRPPGCPGLLSQELAPSGHEPPARGIAALGSSAHRDPPWPFLPSAAQALVGQSPR